MSLSVFSTVNHSVIGKFEEIRQKLNRKSRSTYLFGSNSYYLFHFQASTLVFIDLALLSCWTTCTFLFRDKYKVKTRELGFLQPVTKIWNRVKSVLFQIVYEWWSRIDVISVLVFLLVRSVSIRDLHFCYIIYIIWRKGIWLESQKFR